MSEAPRLSVAIATRNRKESCLELLHSLAHQSLELLPLEAVIVDDGSTDDTGSAVHEFAGGSNLAIRYTHGSAGGLSAARNWAAELARGQFVIFLDDDMLLPDGWLKGWAQLIGEFPDVALAGGRIEVKWPSEKPGDWLAGRYQWIYGHLDYGAENRPLGHREVVNGGHLLVSRELFLAEGGFDAALGHRAGRLGGSEEQDLLARMRQKYPARCYYAGQALVLHRVSPERANQSWALQRLKAASRDRARADRRNGSRLSMAARRAYYRGVLWSAPVLRLDHLRVAECAAYLEGLND